jgi:hypothetical protein
VFSTGFGFVHEFFLKMCRRIVLVQMRLIVLY